MTDEDIEKAIKNVEATLRLSGLQPSAFAKETGIRFLKGELTSEEAIKLITDNILKKKGD